MPQATRDKKTIGELWKRRSAARLHRTLPESWMKAAGIIRDKKQRRDLGHHVKKMRAEWR